MRPANADSSFQIPLRGRGRREKSVGGPLEVTSTGSYNTAFLLGRGSVRPANDAFGTSWENIPVEIQAEDSVSYVRLLTEETLVHDVTAELASHFGNSKFVWSLDENRLSVTAEIEHPPENHPEAEIRWPTEQAPAASDSDDEGDMTRPIVAGNGQPIPIEGAFHIPRIPPLVKETRPGNKTILPPPPPKGAMQPDLALQRVLPDTAHPDAYGEGHTDSLQAVRTSMPPTNHRPARSDAFELFKIMAVTGIFVAAILFMWSTPFSGGQSRDNTTAPHVLPQTMSIKTSSHRDSVLAVPAAAMAGTNVPMHAAAAIPTMRFTRQEVAAASGEQTADEAQAGAPEKSQKYQRNRRRIRSANAGQRQTTRGIQPFGATPQNKEHNAVTVANPTVEQLLASGQSAVAEQPSPRTVHSAMKRISHRIARCRTTVSGRMEVRMKFAGATGKLVTAQVVDNTFRETPAADCALRAVRHVRLPAFSRESINIKYPFYL